MMADDDVSKRNLVLQNKKNMTIGNKTTKKCDLEISWTR